MKKKILVLLLASMVMSVAVGCSKKEQPQTPQQAPQSEQENDIGYEKVVIGLDDTFAPMGFRDEKNEIVGFDIDIAKEVSSIVGFEIEFQPIDWGMKEKELNSKNVDLLWNGYTITEARKEQVLFTRPYLDNRQIVLVPADGGIKTLADLEGKTVATQAESSSEEAIFAKPEIKDTFKELVTFSTYEECLRDMDAGRADAVVADEVLIRYYIANHPEIDCVVIDEDFGDEEYGIGARKDDTALVEAINNALDEIKASGKGKEISEKWFGEDILQ